MRQSIDRKRPWLAALLSAFATGLGHLYLRRFRRAVGWLVVAVGVGLFFVDPVLAESLAAGTLSNPLAAWPVFVVSLLSVLDAYVLARAENVLDEQVADSEEPQAHCSDCGRELDEELSFCPWCSSELDGPASADQPAKEL